MFTIHSVVLGKNNFHLSYEFDHIFHGHRFRWARSLDQNNTMLES